MHAHVNCNAHRASKSARQIVTEPLLDRPRATHPSQAQRRSRATSQQPVRLHPCWQDSLPRLWPQVHRHRRPRSVQPLPLLRLLDPYYRLLDPRPLRTKAGCAIHRFSADELEAAVSQVLLDFYTTQHDVINEAVADAEAAPTRATSRWCYAC